MYWSGCLEAEAEEGHVSLILLWNPEDRDRLLENLIGNALIQKRARSPLSIFFACTAPDSNLYLAVNNTSGEVQLEQPGYKPLRTVADSLEDFLIRLKPAAPYLHPERQGLKALFER
jgi:SecY interacting protein Syd